MQNKSSCEFFSQRQPAYRWHQARLLCSLGPALVRPPLSPLGRKSSGKAPSEDGLDLDVGVAAMAP